MPPSSNLYLSLLLLSNYYLILILLTFTSLESHHRSKTRRQSQFGRLLIQTTIIDSRLKAKPPTETTPQLPLCQDMVIFNFYFDLFGHSYIRLTPIFPFTFSLIKLYQLSNNIMTIMTGLILCPHESLFFHAVPLLSYQTLTLSSFF